LLFSGWRWIRLRATTYMVWMRLMDRLRFAARCETRPNECGFSALCEERPVSSASPTVCALCAERVRCGVIRRAGWLFALLLLAGCSSRTLDPGRPVSARILLEERFPNRAHTSSIDD